MLPESGVLRSISPPCPSQYAPPFTQKASYPAPHMKGSISPRRTAIEPSQNCKVGLPSFVQMQGTQSIFTHHNITRHVVIPSKESSKHHHRHHHPYHPQDHQHNPNTSTNQLDVDFSSVALKQDSTSLTRAPQTQSWALKLLHVLTPFNWVTGNCRARE